MREGVGNLDMVGVWMVESSPPSAAPGTTVLLESADGGLGDVESMEGEASENCVSLSMEAVRLPSVSDSAEEDAAELGAILGGCMRLMNCVVRDGE